MVKSSNYGTDKCRFSVTVVSVVRLMYLLRGNLTAPDITWNFVDIGIWSVVEANTAIVCGMFFARALYNVKLYH